MVRTGGKDGLSSIMLLTNESAALFASSTVLNTRTLVMLLVRTLAVSVEPWFCDDIDGFNGGRWRCIGHPGLKVF